MIDIDFFVLKCQWPHQEKTVLVSSVHMVSDCAKYGFVCKSSDAFTMLKTTHNK
jgi:hypothetical protein